MIGRTGELELFKLQEDLTGPSVDAQENPKAYPSLYALLNDAQPLAREGTPSAYYLFDPKQKLMAGPQETEDGAARQPGREEGLKNGELPKGYEILERPENTVVITCDEDARLCPPNIFPPTQTYYYLFDYAPNAEEPIPQMTGEDLDTDGVRQDFDPRTSSRSS